MTKRRTQTDRNYDTQRRLTERTGNIWNNAARFCWTHDFILEAREKSIFGDPGWKKLPTHGKEYVRGYWDALFRLHYRFLVFCYVIDGKVIAIESSEWEKMLGTLSDRTPDIRENCGHYYRSDLSKPFDVSDLSQRIERQLTNEI